MSGLGLPGVGIPSAARRGGLGSPLRAPHSLSPCRRGPCRNEPVCLQHTFLCVCPAGLQASLQRPVQNKKTGRFSSSGSFLRRGRDSNPRILSDQRFSRPPQSTTLPPLQILRVCFGIAKVGIIFVSPNLFSRNLIFSAE